MENEFKNLSEDKSFVLIDILYPDNFYTNVKSGMNYSIVELLSKGIVFCLTIKNNKEFLNNTLQLIQSNVDMLNQQMARLIDLEEIQKEFDSICKFTIETKKGNTLFDFIWKILFYVNGFKSNALFSQYYDLNFEDNAPNSYVLYISNDKKLISEPFVSNLEEMRIDKILQKTNSKHKPVKKQRQIISKSIRHEVFKKCNFKCMECGATKDTTQLQIDHIIPISRGGTDELDNLQILCQTCNSTKNNKIYSKHDI